MSTDSRPRRKIGFFDPRKSRNLLGLKRVEIEAGLIESIKLSSSKFRNYSLVVNSVIYDVTAQTEILLQLLNQRANISFPSFAKSVE